MARNRLLVLDKSSQWPLEWSRTLPDPKPYTYKNINSSRFLFFFLLIIIIIIMWRVPHVASKVLLYKEMWVRGPSGTQHQAYDRQLRCAPLSQVHSLKRASLQLQSAASRLRLCRGKCNDNLGKSRTPTETWRMADWGKKKKKGKLPLRNEPDSKKGWTVDRSLWREHSVQCRNGSTALVGQKIST